MTDRIESQQILLAADDLNIFNSNTEYSPGHLLLPERIPELDGLRGMAALMVVFHHLSQSFPGDATNRLLVVWLKLTHAGWIGVDIFFALSGFLITRNLIETRQAKYYYRNFYARRVLRLAPPYLITLGLVALFVPQSHAFLILSFFYLANFAQSFGISMVYGPLWSLAVEEHFYLIWPWLIRFLHRRTFFGIAIAVCVLTPILRYIAQVYAFFNPYVSWFRFDGLLWGALLAILVTSPNSNRELVQWWSTVIGLIGLLGFIVGAFAGSMGRHSIIGSTFVFGLVAMATSGFIGHAMLGTFRRAFALFRHPLARFLGNISYWVYLFHYLMILTFMRFFVSWGGNLKAYLGVAFIVLATSILSGVIVRQVVEKPALSLKRYFRSTPEAKLRKKEA